VWARRHGATDGYLQVADGNAGAIDMYQRLGFTEHHRYHYRRLP
jgi:ribosomal protein S18 acetylase RimI-like enzyme